MLTCKHADNSIRWKKGERLDQLFEQRCDQLDTSNNGNHAAIITDNATLTFRELDNRANQVARYLMDHGVTSGNRVALLFDKTVERYVALLAVLKANAAYVPLDASFPKERIEFILADADVKAILSLSSFDLIFNQCDLPKFFLDTAKNEIDVKPTARLTENEKSAPKNQLCYIIYTSGTTGHPKGVSIEHPSICNFVKVAAEVYGIEPHDRVYQGMTIAFDFSVEELWVPLMAGAVLVPGTPGTNLVGEDLADFLIQQKVTVLCCVPTLLGTIEKDLPDLRILLVSGEACPQNLVDSWYKPGRKILNAYGPTEATVTATLTELYPKKPVTIGTPLPTYTIVILNEENHKALKKGSVGEIGIAGIGLADGYLNRNDLTKKKFIPDFLNIPNNPSKRIYRTGDIGRINENNEVEFYGRIDTQVKIRGYRIELSEIEAILLQLPEISQAVVHTYESEFGVVELVAYYTLNMGASDISLIDVAKKMRRHLPGYMIPAYFEKLPAIPMTSSNKVDRKSLPTPKRTRFIAATTKFVPPRTGIEEKLAQALIEVMKVDHVSVEDNFFYDLGADSLLMAKFCSVIRRYAGAASVSMKDIYLNPTIAKLAGILQSTTDEDNNIESKPEPFHMPTNFEYYGCGALQLLYYIGFILYGFGILVTGVKWTYPFIENPTELYMRIVGFSFALFVMMSALPILIKWLLIGKWKEEVIPIWSLRYFRFWLVKNLIRTNPMVLFVGSPLYNVYLKLLGARIGRNTVIESSLPPVCTDLVSVGDNTIIRRDAIIPGYKAQFNHIYTGSINIGSNVLVGEASMLDINTNMEDNSQLGHSSSLQSGQCVPEGKQYHGSPAQESGVDFLRVESKPCSPLRRLLYTMYQLILSFAIATPAAVMFIYYLFTYYFGQSNALPLYHESPGSSLILLEEMFFISFVLFFCSLLFGLLVVSLIPRLLQPLLSEDRTYVRYGVRYVIYQLVSHFSNSPVYNLLFGDSNFIVYYLRWVGCRLNKIVQTGANFGLDQRHDNPFLCDVGSGTMVSDGLTMMNAVTTNSSFRLSKVKIGECNYLGNNIFYPADSKSGANCLLATKVMVPVDGPLRENVGILGSPCFEIPRAVDRDRLRYPTEKGEARRQRIRKKAFYNSRTIAVFLFCNWLFIFALFFCLAVAFVYYPVFGIWIFFLYGLVAVLFGIGFFSFIERASLGFRRLKPKIVSMYDKYFWFHERHWKFCGNSLLYLFKGTPFKNIVSRLLGMKVGKKVFDDGCRFYDKTLIEIGDYTNLNEGCVIQGHSLEEGIFKCDHIKIGTACSLGPGAFVHYGVSMSDRVVLDPDSFLMKGESPHANTAWRGNPANIINP